MLLEICSKCEYCSNVAQSAKKFFKGAQNAKQCSQLKTSVPKKSWTSFPGSSLFQVDPGNNLKTRLIIGTWCPLGLA